MRRMKIKPCQYFIKFRKEASWSFFLTLTQNDLSVFQEIYLGSKEEYPEYYFQTSHDFCYKSILSWNLGICVQWEIYTVWLLRIQKAIVKVSDDFLQGGRPNFRKGLVCYSMLWNHSLWWRPLYTACYNRGRQSLHRWIMCETIAGSLMI